MQIVMWKVALFLAFVALGGCVLQGIFINTEHKKNYKAAVVLKGLAAFVFCFIGLVAYLFALMGLISVDSDPQLKGSILKLVVYGLLFGALGDILLNLRFVYEKYGQKIFLCGIAVFLTGHIFYLVSLIKLSTMVIAPVAAGILLAFILLVIIFKSFEIKLAFKIFGVVYIGAVSLMACFAITNLITMPSVYTLMYGIGGLLFLISDVVLIFNTFGPEQKFSLRITNLSLYYLGQLLIASSLFFIK